MNSHTTTDTEWGRCPQGQIEGVVRRVRFRRQRALARRLTGNAFVGVVLAVVALQIAESDLFDQYRNYGYGGVACTEVRDRMQDYASGRTSEVLSARIEAHLRQCRYCQALIAETAKETGDR